MIPPPGLRVTPCHTGEVPVVTQSRPGPRVSTDSGVGRGFPECGSRPQWCHTVTSPWGFVYLLILFSVGLRHPTTVSVGHLGETSTRTKFSSFSVWKT